MTDKKPYVRVFHNLIQEEKFSAEVETKWNPPEGLFKSADSDKIANSTIRGHRGNHKKAIQSLTFYINRAGKNLPADQKSAVNAAIKKIQDMDKKESYIRQFVEAKMQWWCVYLNGKEIDKIQYDASQDANDVKKSLVGHDGYDPNITVEKEKTSKKEYTLKENELHDPNCDCAECIGGAYTPLSDDSIVKQYAMNVGPGSYDENIRKPYVREFIEENDESKDVSLIDRALKLCIVIEDDIREGSSKEDTLETLDKIINILKQLKAKEETEQAINSGSEEDYFIDQGIKGKEKQNPE